MPTEDSQVSGGRAVLDPVGRYTWRSSIDLIRTMTERHAIDWELAADAGRAAAARREAASVRSSIGRQEAGPVIDKANERYSKLSPTRR